MKNPRHPYTQHLINSLPRLDDRAERESIPGRPPALDNPPGGCRFHPRCPLAIDRCRTIDPEAISVQPGHRVACHLVKEEVSSATAA